MSVLRSEVRSCRVDGRAVAILIEVDDDLEMRVVRGTLRRSSSFFGYKAASCFEIESR